jgi:hypothetical protein
MDQNATLNDTIEQEFNDLDRGWVAAYLQGTTELFDRVWADGFIFMPDNEKTLQRSREQRSIQRYTFTRALTLAVTN